MRPPVRSEINTKRSSGLIGWGCLRSLNIWLRVVTAVWQAVFSRSFHAVILPREPLRRFISNPVGGSLAFVSWKDRKAVAAGFKVIYQSITVTEAEQELEAFARQWDKQYPSISASWRRHWVNLIAFFDYPDEIRKVIYTTNAIESLNSVIHKATERRKLFPSDQSAMKVVYLAIEQAAKNWSMPIHNWKPALNQFMMLYEDRLPDIF